MERNPNSKRAAQLENDDEERDLDKETSFADRDGGNYRNSGGNSGGSGGGGGGGGGGGSGGGGGGGNNYKRASGGYQRFARALDYRRWSPRLFCLQKCRQSIAVQQRR